MPLAGGSAAHAEARQRGAQGPEHCLIMNGAAVRLQRRMPHALEGRRIVITRAREQAADLARALEAHGAAVVVAPVIRIEPLPQLGPLRAALAGLSAYRWVVFTSQNAVQIVFDRLLAWGLGPRAFASTPVAAIGTATGEALAKRGVVPALVPDEFVGEALAEALAAHGTLAGSRVLIPSAEDARDALATGLKQHGAVVEVVPVYRTVRADTDLTVLAAELVGGEVDAVTFTASSTVRAFVDLVGRRAATSGRFAAVVIGPVTGRTARELGLADVIEAEPHTVTGLVDALVRRLA
jgi:uroporphyrinogen III methyltransferase / synthase